MSGKSKSKIKVPKRVAGVKIPKVVRKGPVLDFVNSSAGRLLLAEALTAAVALFANEGLKGGKGKQFREAALDVEDSLKQNTTRLAYAFGEGVRAFREALTQPDLVGRDDTDEPADSEDAPPPSKKNFRRPSPEVTA